MAKVPEELKDQFQDYVDELLARAAEASAALLLFYLGIEPFGQSRK